MKKHQGEKKHSFFRKKNAFRKKNNMLTQATTTTTTTNDSKPALSFKTMFFAKQKTAVQQVFPTLILKKKKKNYFILTKNKKIFFENVFTFCKKNIFFVKKKWNKFSVSTKIWGPHPMFHHEIRLCCTRVSTWNPGKPKCFTMKSCCAVTRFSVFTT